MACSHARRTARQTRVKSQRPPAPAASRNPPPPLNTLDSPDVPYKQLAQPENRRTSEALCSLNPCRMKSRTRLSLAAVVAFVGIALWIGLNHLDTTANGTIDKTAPTSSKRTEPVCPKSPEAASAIKAGTKLKPIASDNAPSFPAASESSKYEDSEIGSAYADFINGQIQGSV